MSVKLVRANSDTPNIQNNDDCRLFRYACGGYDGIVKGFGNELNYEISGSNFIVKSGEFVIDGWQGKVDGSGVSIAVDNLGGIQYYVVYAEIDLSVGANQKAEIKATYNTAYYPTISRGDDLTTTPSGVARIELYRFEASSGVISNVQRKFKIINYGWIINSENATNSVNAQKAPTAPLEAKDASIANTDWVKNAALAGLLGLKVSTYTNNANNNSKMPHKWTEVIMGDYLFIFGRVNALEGNSNVNVSWNGNKFKSADFFNNDAYTLITSFTTQTRDDDRGMDEPTHAKTLNTNGFVIYNSNGFTTTGTYMAFGKKA